MKKPKRVRLTKALYEEAVKRAERAEYLLEHDYEPRPENRAAQAGWYGASLLDTCPGGQTWQERYRTALRGEAEQIERADLAESTHRAMAEALDVWNKGQGFGPAGLAILSAWAGRGMQDKPEEPEKT